MFSDTLMNASPKKLTELQYAVMSDRERNVLVNFPFTPVVEKPGSEDPIVMDDPLMLIRQQFAKQIPLIMGITNEEGAGLAGHVIANMEKYQSSMIDQLIPFALNIGSDQNKRDIYEEIKGFFFKDNDLSLETVSIMVQILGDNANKYAGYDSAVLHSRFQKYENLKLDFLTKTNIINAFTSRSPLYFYIFSHISDLNKMRQLAETPENCPGAVHGDDLCYLFE